MATKGDFLVRVGGNVNLLSEQADIKRLKGGIVLCWPKGKMDSGEKPLRLRLVKVKIGKTTMWMLTSVLNRKRLPNKKIIKYQQFPVMRNPGGKGGDWRGVFVKGGGERVFHYW